jgi:stage II sporulation protein P
MYKHNLSALVKGIVFVQLIVLVIVLGVSVNINQKYIQAMKLLNSDSIMIPFAGPQISDRQAEMLLRENNVMMAGGEDMPGRIIDKEYSAATYPKNIIGSNIQALALSELTSVPVLEEEDDSPLQTVKDDDSIVLDSTTLARFSKSKVVFYCTHSAESYIPNSGKARLDGKRGLINQVAATLETNLADRGLPAQFVETIHDYPDYNQSYTKSRATVKQVVAANKNVLGLFDVHRDSIPGEGKASVVKINGHPSAKILIVVGTNQRKPHPNWEQNRKFADRIYQTAEKKYPGLIKGIVNKAGTYNQEYHPRALLLEFGTDSNTLSEVTYAAQLFSDVLIEVLKEAP